MALEAQSEDRGEQALLDLPRPADARIDCFRARGPQPHKRVPGERRVVALPGRELPPAGDRERDPAGGLLRRHLLACATGLAVVVASAPAGYLYWDYSEHFQSTDDAFIATRQFAVAPKVSGHITAVLVNENQHVAVGDVIARIDDRDYRIALEQAQAQ